MKIMPISINNFLPESLFKKVKNQIINKNMGPNGEHFYHTVAGRWLTEIHFDQETEEEILKIAKKTFNNPNLKRAGFHTARYQMQDGIKPQLWKHWDQSACKYSFDLFIEKTIDWTLVVEDKEFQEQPNSCVIFSGNDMLHWRTEYPSDNEEDYVLLLFMQFAGIPTGLNNLFEFAGVSFNEDNSLEGFGFQVSDFWDYIFGDVTGLLATLIGTGIAIGLFATGRADIAIFAGIASAVLVLFLPAIVFFVSYALTHNFSAWATAMLAIIFIPLAVGYIIALFKYIGGGS
jgi:hypothetical protein